ncbi:MAG: GntR family transcriptional regulator [Candidatus Phosphoribacter baldrii]
MGKKNSITKSVRASLTNYKPGDRLPGVAEVCEEYDASTATAVYAMRALLDEGLVRSVQGGNGGYFLVKHPVETRADLLARLADTLADASTLLRKLATLESEPAA